MDVAFDDFEEDWGTILRRNKDLERQAASKIDRLARFREAKNCRDCRKQAKELGISQPGPEREAWQSCSQVKEREPWLQHHRRWLLLKARSDLGLLSVADIPWPPRDDGIVAAYARLTKAEGLWDAHLEPAELRTAFHRAQMRWHPDKFFNMFGAYLECSEADEILDRVKFISQQINSEWHKVSQDG